MYHENLLPGNLFEVLGDPVRYVYSASEFTGYIINADGTYRCVKAYAVDFEVACDLKDLSEARDSSLVNSHIVNVLEPGLSGDEYNAYVSHFVILDRLAYDLLVSYSNTEGLSCKYSGVVNGYSVSYIREKFDSFEIDNTGLCLLPSFVKAGGLTYPEIPFDETKHKRFMQLVMAKNSYASSSVNMPFLQNASYI